MIVDDDDLIRGVLARSLIDDGFNVLTAAHSAEALSTLKALPDIDVVVMDIHLPGLSGFELATKIEEQKLVVKVVFMSGTPEARVEADIRSKPFLAKPLHMKSSSGACGRPPTLRDDRHILVTTGLIHFAAS